MAEHLTALFEGLHPLWEMSFTAAWVAGVVFLLRLLLKNRAPKRVLCLLWLVVFARLLVPVNLESPVSLVPPALTETAQIQTPAPPQGGTAFQPATPAQSAVPMQTADPTGTSPLPMITVPDSAENTPAPEASPFPLEALAVGVWLIGAAGMLGYGIVTWFRLRRRVRFAVRVSGKVWEDETVPSPFILGLFRPRVYLPAGLEENARRYILCHEFAHLRRLDHVIKPVCWLALVLHWFNPAVWAAFLLLGRDMEGACDEAVLRALGEDVKAGYSYTLLALASGGRVPAPCPLAFDGGDTKGRIKHVLSYRRPALWIIVASVIAVIVAAVCLLTDPVAAEGSDPPAPTESEYSSTPSNEPAPTPGEDPNDLLDPWMLEVLNGERTFFINGADRDMDHLAEALFDGEPRESLGMVTLAILDLDRDGTNELIVWPFGEEDNTVVYQTGHLILRQEGEEIRGYRPAYRSFCHLAADGIFSWTVNKYSNGSGRARFEDGKFTTEPVTWRDHDDFFVNNQPATQEEFDAAIDAQLRQPGPTWYVLGVDVLMTEDDA